MPVIVYPIGLWLFLHLTFGAFALDAKIRCDQGNPLPDQVCPEKTPGAKAFIPTVVTPTNPAPVSLSLPVNDDHQLCGGDGCKSLDVKP